MDYFALFFYCFLWSFLGVIPPGIININAAKISVGNSKTLALIFTLGACFIIAMQAGIAVLIAEYLNFSSEELSSIKKIGILIFFALSIYFFKAAKSAPKPKELNFISKKGYFLRGMLFSALNVFPIPYYSFVCSTLTASNNFSFSTLDVILFITAIVLGSFLAIAIYIVLFKTVSSTNFNKKANYFLSIITIGLALYTLINLYF